ncbi:MAG: ABC transporter permease [SAR324 cluster bacterium]|nr:ABC transporter permease [SAR324 cluster bacterium]MDG2064077.1 ABC transporter permease [SAR324 cluster bacterium]RZO40062.1 MAG: ABC transporter permease [Pseudomonadota bacterium]
MWIDFLLILDATLRISVPFVFAAMGGIFAERSGVIDFGLEGKMLGGAFVAATIAYWTQSAWWGLLGSIGIGIIFSMIHGYASISKRGNQVVSCVAINIFAMGLTVVLANAWFGMGGKTPQLPKEARFMPIKLPYADELRDVPILGDLYYELISGHSILVYIAFVVVPITAWVIFKSSFGLRLRATGENPLAVDTTGISVNKTRYQALLFNGILGGISGAYLSTAHLAFFVKDMSAGKGYIALAAMIVGKWRPYPAMFACLLFSFLFAIKDKPEVFDLLKGIVPVKLLNSFLDMSPYILTVIFLAGFVGKAVAPKAIGQPFSKEK